MTKELEVQLADVPILDVHTHLVGGKLAAPGLHDILLYHMVVSDLYASGCPSGTVDPVSRLAEPKQRLTRGSRRRYRICGISPIPAPSGASESSCRALWLDGSDRRAKLDEVGRLDSRTG